MASDVGGLARPRVDETDAVRVARDHWDVEGSARELGSQQDRNFLIESAGGSLVLKFANDTTAPAELEAQNAALAALAAAGLRVPVAMPSTSGAAIERVKVGESELLTRALVFVDGTPLIETPAFGEREAEQLGDTAGRIASSLAGFGHAGAQRSTQWDLRVATEVVTSLIDQVPEQWRRDRLLAATAEASARLSEVADRLPVQTIHADVTDDNVVIDADGAIGVIDFGDLQSGWRVAELAATGAAVFAHDVADPVALLLTLVRAFARHVTLTDAGLVLRASDLTLYLGGVTGWREGPVRRGEPLAVVDEATVSVRLCTVPSVRPPFLVTPRGESSWLALCPDPSALVGTDVRAPQADADALLARRDAAFARVQEHYYDRPPQIERGWREHLIDSTAQSFVDVVNNVATTGHSHPRLVAAAARQWALLNTNSRFHYAAVAELSERLAGLAPTGLDTVFLVNSGSEAVDLALRLAMTATGRSRILAAREAYHGWTIGSDAVSTSLGDNPRALQSRPSWVELIDAPNAIRGRHTGADAGARYLDDLDARLHALGAEGRANLAGVILEPIFGNGGGVLLPNGYLSGVYERVRALGGVCIADEVQVGYGRLGEYFWGFEQQNAVPDVITIAKAMGNGQPIGAVITTAAIAEAFAAEGSFFSSAGGSPVSARIGLAVLDIMRDEELQRNAADVGGRFKAGLEALATRHPAIGAVHGLGLYLGVELVTDRTTFAPASELATQVCEAMLDEGVIVQPTGDHKNVLKVKPPLCIIDQSASTATEALDRVLTGLGR